MKKNFLLLALMILISQFSSAQADKVIGFWLTENDSSQVEIYKAEDGKYYGKISWLEEPNEDGKPKMDTENPDESLRTTIVFRPFSSWLQYTVCCHGNYPNTHTYGPSLEDV